MTPSMTMVLTPVVLGKPLGFFNARGEFDMSDLTVVRGSNVSQGREFDAHEEAKLAFGELNGIATRLQNVVEIDLLKGELSKELAGILKELQQAVSLAERAKQKHIEISQDPSAYDFDEILNCGKNSARATFDALKDARELLGDKIRENFQQSLKVLTDERVRLREKYEATIEKQIKALRKSGVRVMADSKEGKVVNTGVAGKQIRYMALTTIPVKEVDADISRVSNWSNSIIELRSRIGRCLSELDHQLRRIAVAALRG